jgi:PAS domain-containing protein
LRQLSRQNARMQVSELVECALEQQQEYAIILLDEQARVVAWFPGATRTFGYRSEEMIDQTLTRLFTPEDQARGDPDAPCRLEAKVSTREPRSASDCPCVPRRTTAQAGPSFQIQATSGTPANTTRTDSGSPNFQ